MWESGEKEDRARGEWREGREGERGWRARKRELGRPTVGGSEAPPFLLVRLLLAYLIPTFSLSSVCPLSVLPFTLFSPPPPRRAWPSSLSSCTFLCALPLLLLPQALAHHGQRERNRQHQLCARLYRPRYEQRDFDGALSLSTPSSGLNADSRSRRTALTVPSVASARRRRRRRCTSSCSRCATSPSARFSCTR